MKVDMVGDSAFGLPAHTSGGDGTSRRDPAASMAQGIVVGAIGSLGLWALVGAVVMSLM